MGAWPSLANSRSITQTDSWKMYSKYFMSQVFFSKSGHDFVKMWETTQIDFWKTHPKPRLYKNFLQSGKLELWKKILNEFFKIFRPLFSYLDNVIF